MARSSRAQAKTDDTTVTEATADPATEQTTTAAEDTDRKTELLDDRGRTLAEIRAEIAAYDVAKRDKDLVAVTAAKRAIDAGVTRLIELAGTDEPATVVDAILESVAAESGVVPLWGQPGRWVQMISGVACDVIWGGAIKPALAQIRPVDFEHEWLSEEPVIDLAFAAVDADPYTSLPDWIEALAASALGKSRGGIWTTHRLRDGAKPDQGDPAWSMQGHLFQFATNRAEYEARYRNLELEQSRDTFALELGVDTCRGDVRDRMLAWFKTWVVNSDGERVWNRMPEASQKQVITAADEFAAELVRRVGSVVLSVGYQTVELDLEQFTAKDGLKIVLTARPTDDLVLALLHARGKEVQLITGPAVDMMGERAPARADPDQHAMFEDEPEVDEAEAA